MKTKSIFFSLIVIAVTASFSLSAQSTGFSGEWKLDQTKTANVDNQLFLAGVIIKLKADSLLTTRIYENGMGEQYTFDENLSLDGKDAKIVIYDMPRTSKVTKSASDGSLSFESTTTFNGQYGEENLLAKETWKIDPEGKLLTIDFTNKMADNETTGTNYYNRAVK